MVMRVDDQPKIDSRVQLVELLRCCLDIRHFKGIYGGLSFKSVAKAMIHEERKL